jgi:hypothetical protein
MKCLKCGSDTRMMVQTVITAPGDLFRNLPKAAYRRKDVELKGVLWETADFICTNPECQHVTDGYGNYVTGLAKALKEVDDFFALRRSELGCLSSEAEKLVAQVQKALGKGA